MSDSLDYFAKCLLILNFTEEMARRSESIGFASMCIKGQKEHLPSTKCG
uniref:Uncharacterized protein n=1 Tax=Cyprinus carpio TaxID=7962 RepID=A0A8C1U1J8_CYPCA